MNRYLVHFTVQGEHYWNESPIDDFDSVYEGKKQLIAHDMIKEVRSKTPQGFLDGVSLWEKVEESSTLNSRRYFICFYYSNIPYYYTFDYSEKGTAKFSTAKELIFYKIQELISTEEKNYKEYDVSNQALWKMVVSPDEYSKSTNH